MPHPNAISDFRSYTPSWMDGPPHDPVGEQIDDLQSDIEDLHAQLAVQEAEHAKAYALWQRLLPLLPASLTQDPKAGQLVGALTDTLECIAAADCRAVGDKLLAEVGL
jgi:hypothetical protein